ncbi:TRAP transporter, DctM subunit [Tistlia consotensis]|uniref:TRAP transporter large permease protein n=1 Tax=Tistlia consotensis USBA 355 TaxID=560819 RepID=A0A1Y6BDN2_9PROT|nr:TRAP transporter large permease [Tistlia consotensis]SMF02312.1 TRAP transporter, DctM subunit [Tistlia consotensis USBA 355]SNS26716.1 TRAP transporter, DctM subunit [Tistlia consotensis]
MSAGALGLLVGLLLLGLPIAFSIILACGLAVAERGLPAMLIAQRLFTGLDSFPIMAVPLFILAGELMNESGITRRIIDLADAFVGHLRTGLCQVGILSSVIFAGISGSAVADASALGRVFIPAMEEEGYPRAFSGALIAAASVIGPIIPPSIPMIIFALIIQESIASLFLAGVVPGLLLGLGIALTGYLRIRRLAPEPKPRRSARELLAALRQGIIPMLMPVIILATILSGVVTPTEAAAVAVLYALLIGFFVLRTLKLASLLRIFASSMLLASIILIVMASASLVNWLLTTDQVPQQFAAFVLGTVKDPVAFLLLTNVLLLVVGCFIEGLAAMIVLVPILFPVAQALHVDPVHFGTVVVLNLMIGLITPPMGLCLFVADGVAKVGLAAIVRQIWPFLLAELAVLLAVTLVPGLALGLPRLLGY